MARAHQEAPKAEKPKDLSPLFDFSEENAEASLQEAPKKRARTAPPIPIEAFRPKKRAKKEPIASEGKMSISVSGEITAKEEESPYEEMKIEQGPTAAQQEAETRENLRAETIELHDRFQEAQAEFEATADAVDRRAKEIAADLSARNFPADTILVWTEAIQKREGLQEKMEASMDKMIAARKDYIDRYEAWERTQRADEKAAAEMEKVIDDLAAAHQPASAAFTGQEEAWFKKGEEEEQQMAAARAEIDAAGGKAESLVETPAEIDANVRQAEAMVASGELNPTFFNINDYRHLLTRKAQIDADLEAAGWWQARKLRSELKEVQKDLGDYEQQLHSVARERAGERDKARVSSMTPEQKKAQEKKTSLWSRITGR